MKKLLLLAILLTPCAQADVSKLAEALYFEAVTEPRRCQIMVANVIMNRVADRRWPDTIYDVIEQPQQFSYLSDGKPETITSPKRYIDMLKISNDVIGGKIKDLTGGANHYVNHNISSATWHVAMELTGKCGQHWFYLS